MRAAPPEPSPDQLNSTKQTAAKLGCSPGHVRNLIEHELLDAIDIGIGRRKFRISDHAINTYREAQAAKPKPGGRPQLVLLKAVA
jgi:hypothetical protein